MKRIVSQITGLWGKWTLVQKLILGGVAAAAIVGIVVLLSVSSAPAMVPLIDTPITDETKRDAIIVRLNEENVHSSVSATGIISVPDEATARRMRSILIREDLIPQNVDLV